MYSPCKIAEQTHVLVELQSFPECKRFSMQGFSVSANPTQACSRCIDAGLRSNIILAAGGAAAAAAQIDCKRHRPSCCSRSVFALFFAEAQHRKRRLPLLRVGLAPTPHRTRNEFQNHFTKSGRRLLGSTSEAKSKMTGTQLRSRLPRSLQRPFHHIYPPFHCS